MNTLQDILKTCELKKDDKSPSTHTRIPDKDLNIYGGKWNITPETENNFYGSLYEHTIINGKKEYLTEKQLENGTFVVDLDFRYSPDVSTRQHTNQHINEFVELFIQQISEYSVIDNPFKCYVMEKPNVNRLADGSLTKDGIHLLFTLGMSKDHKLLIRDSVIKESVDVFPTDELPLINDWNSVYDKGVMEGSVNWNIYGCSKPANETYQVVKMYDYTIDPADGNLMVDIIYNPKITKEMYMDLSVRKQRPLVKPNKKALDRLTKLKLPEKQNSPRSVAELETHAKDKYIELINTCGDSNEKIIHADWFCIATFLKTHGYDKQFFRDFTEKYVSNKLSELDDIWDKYIKMETRMNPKAVENITYKYNPDGLKMWKLKYPEKMYFAPPEQISNIYDCSKLITPYLSETIKLCCNEWWVLSNSNLWEIIKEPVFYVITEVRRYLDHSNAELTNKIKLMPDGEEKNEKLKISKAYLSLYNDINKGSYTTQLLKYLQPQLRDDHFTEKLNINVNKIAYKNGMLDLTTLEFRPYLLASDYITHTIPYDYKTATEEDKTALKKELLKICNNKQKHLDYYLSTLGYAMTGDSSKLQEFYYLMGVKACNGKSVVFEALNEIIPNYSMSIENTSLEAGNSQLHKEVASWSGKRIGWVNELTKRKQDAEVIKLIADGTKIKYKIMYGGSGIMNVGFKLFVISNHSISIDGDNGVARRLRVEELDSEFLDDIVEDDYENCKFKKDKNFGKDLICKYKYALMDLIYEYSNKFITNGKLTEYPDEWNKETKATISDNNKFKEFFEKWFVVDSKAVVGKQVVEDILTKYPEKNIKIREELKRCGIPFEYDSVKKAPKRREQGTYKGFRDKTDEELLDEQGEV